MDAALGVIFMRSGYEAIEALGVENMMDFQVRFWKLRQSEWEKYAKPRGVIQAQGDLSNIAYFDFIAFAQMAAADACLREKKKQNAQALLLDAHFRATGDNILRSLREEEAAIADGDSRRRCIPPLTMPPHEAAEEILAMLAERGYAVETRVVVRSSSPSRASRARGGDDGFVTSVYGSASLWGVGELLRRGCVCSTAYERPLIAAWLREASTTEAEMEWQTNTFIELGSAPGCVKTVWALDAPVV